CRSAWSASNLALSVRIPAFLLISDRARYNLSNASSKQATLQPAREAMETLLATRFLALPISRWSDAAIRATADLLCFSKQSFGFWHFPASANQTEYRRPKSALRFHMPPAD